MRKEETTVTSKNTDKECTHIIYHGKKIVEFDTVKEVKKHSNGGYIYLPKELIGKKVKVVLLE